MLHHFAKRYVNGVKIADLWKKYVQRKLGKFDSFPLRKYRHFHVGILYLESPCRTNRATSNLRYERLPLSRLCREWTRMMILVVEAKNCLRWAWWEHRLISFFLRQWQMNGHKISDWYLSINDSWLCCCKSSVRMNPRFLTAVCFRTSATDMRKIYYI